jgi:hypothetical protein
MPSPSLASSRPVVHALSPLPLDGGPDYESWEMSRVEAALDRLARSDEGPDQWRSLILGGSPSASRPPSQLS